MANFIGIDIGATNTRIAAVDSTGEIKESLRLPSQLQTGRPFFQAVGEAAAKLGEKYQALACGVGSAGQIHKATGAFLPGLYPDAPWVGVPLREIIENATELPTFVDNDCKIAAYAEYKIGVATGVQDFISLTLGTGLGGGIIVNGQLVQGAKGIAGHVGHISINPQGPLCQCGTKGCLELYASGTAVAKRAGKLMGKEISSPEVFQKAHQGDEKGLTIINDMANALGHGLGILANILNPELFVLGGSIMEWWPLLEKTVLESFHSNVMAELKNTPILISQLDGQGGVIGAALYGKDSLKG